MLSLSVCLYSTCMQQAYDRPERIRARSITAVKKSKPTSSRNNRDVTLKMFNKEKKKKLRKCHPLFLHCRWEILKWIFFFLYNYTSPLEYLENIIFFFLHKKWTKLDFRMRVHFMIYSVKLITLIKELLIAQFLTKGQNKQSLFCIF